MKPSHRLATLPKAILADRRFAIGLMFLLATTLVANAQFEMPSRGIEVNEVRRPVNKLVDNSQSINSQTHQQNGKSPEMHLQVSSDQYRALKYLATGGCVTLILVLLGSMIRLSAGEAAFPQPIAGNTYAAAQHVPYSQAPWGYPPQPHPSAAQSSSKENVNDLGTKVADSPTQNHQPPNTMQVTYLPALPIGIPFGWQPAVPAVSGQVAFSAPTVASPFYSQTVNGAREELVQEPSETSPSETERQQAPEDKLSVEETLMKQLDSIESDSKLVTDNHAEVLNTPDAAEKLGSPPENAPSVDPYPEGEMRDLIAEDLANLPVETYGEESTVNEVMEAASGKSEDADQKLNGKQILHGEHQQTDDADESKPLTSSVGSKAGVKSIFDSIVANTIAVKSLAS